MQRGLYASGIIDRLLGNTAKFRHAGKFPRRKFWLQAAVPPVSADVAVAGQMDDMMQYYDSLRKLPPSDLGRIYDKVKQNFAQNKSDVNRARLVLLAYLA